MTSYMRDAKRYLLRPLLKEAAGVSVRYHAASTGLTYDLVATQHDVKADAETSQGIQFTEQVKDFILDVADLPVSPIYLDRIEVLTDEDGNEELGIANQWYQVLSTGSSRSHEPNDAHEDTYRLHTKNVPAPADTQPVFGNAGGDVYGSADGDPYAGSSS